MVARVYLKEDPRVVLLTFTGFKPVYDAYRIVCDVPQAVGQAFDQDLTFAMTRVSETVLESLFQSCMQAVALAGAERRGRRRRPRRMAEGKAGGRREAKTRRSGETQATSKRLDQGRSQFLRNY